MVRREGVAGMYSGLSEIRTAPITALLGAPVEMIDRLQDALPESFEPLVLLPSQYHDTLRRRGSLDGLRKLLLAVLEDAIHCYLKNMNAKDRRHRIAFYEAREWINAKQGRGPFAFEMICDEFGIHAASLRCALDKRRRLLDVASIHKSPPPCAVAPGFTADPGEHTNGLSAICVEIPGENFWRAP